MMGSLTAFALVSQLVMAQKLRDEYPWYSTGDEIHSTIEDLSKNCPGVDFQVSTRSAVNGGENAGQAVEIDVVRISKKDTYPQKKAFFVFGEHARELISPETGLHFMKTICGQSGGAMRRDLVDRVLGSTSFVVLPNVNPLGRKHVEDGEYCKRTNEDAVDLNRNWGDQHRDAKLANSDDEMNPGPYGFSEPETQVIRDLAMEEKPDIFLSVHSGAYFMGTPFGYNFTEPSNEHEMQNLLAPISEKFCNSNCPYGGLADMIGYKSIGCDLDWMKENLNTPYAFTWEIYIGSDARRYYIEKARAHNEKREMNEEANMFFFRNSFNLLQSKVVTRKYESHAHMGVPESAQHPSDCFEQFNPESAAETQEVTDNWTGAFLTLCDEVSSRAFWKLNDPSNSSVASQADGPVSATASATPTSTAEPSSASSASPESQGSSPDPALLPKVVTPAASVLARPVGSVKDPWAKAPWAKRMSELFDNQRLSDSFNGLPQADGSSSMDTNVSPASTADRSSLSAALARETEQSVGDFYAQHPANTQAKDAFQSGDQDAKPLPKGVDSIKRMSELFGQPLPKGVSQILRYDGQSQADGSSSINTNASPAPKLEDASQDAEALPKVTDSVKRMSQLFDRQFLGRPSQG